MNAFLRAENLSFSYGAEPVLTNLNFALGKGQCLSVVGPSGSGKTTLLHLLGGLLQPTTGKLWLHDTLIRGPSRERMIVFQNHALLPWLTCLDNVVFSLECAPKPPPNAGDVARIFLRKVGLDAQAGAYPASLSGGMQQRLGIARALAADPLLLLLDEPFSALDVPRRRHLFGEMSGLVKREGKTAVLVTHDVSEAIQFGDRLLVLGSQPIVHYEPKRVSEQEIYAAWTL
jgi:ABC-type nitrate/sulfonate/bicarbonate transport system ATPase subunit